MRSCSGRSKRNSVTSGGESSECGVLLVDKPAGITSHDVVDRLRRISGLRKVGHGGTLDPFATGLMLVLAGRATKLFDYLMPLDKRYRVTVQFGSVSTTGDTDGEISDVEGGSRVSRKSLAATLPGFRGRIQQRVPAYSAVKVGGRPLYKTARRGQEVKAPTREVEIRELELVSFEAEAQEAVLEVACSKGTYIRQLSQDLGEALGSGAYTSNLRRTAVGEFTAHAASTLDELERIERDKLLTPANPAFISCAGALYFLPGRDLAEEDLRAVSHGQPIAGEEADLVRLMHGGRLLALYGPGEKAGLIYPRVVLV